MPDEYVSAIRKLDGRKMVGNVVKLKTSSAIPPGEKISIEGVDGYFRVVKPRRKNASRTANIVQA